MTSWFRSWHGAPTDNKWLVIAAKAKVTPGIVSAVAWALFDHASQADERGDVTDFDTETYAVFSGFDECQVQAVIAAMHTKGVIDEDGRLHAWDKRQPKREDDSAERVRRHRERKSAESNGDNGGCNGVTQRNELKRTETHVTHTEADTEQNRAEAEVVTAAAAAADPAVTFTDLYKRTWALLPASEYEQEKITDWSKRVAVEAWEYALRECVGHRHVGEWKYFEKILRRVEKEGLPVDLPEVVPPTANGKIAGFSLAELTGGA